MVSLSFLCGFSRLAVLLDFIMGFKKKKNCNRDLLVELPKGEIIRILVGKSLVIPKRVIERLKPTSSLSSEGHCCKYLKRFLEVS